MGEMEEPNYPVEEVSGSWQMCLSLCYDQDNCLIVAETDYGCFLYGYSNFTSLLIHDKSTGRYKIGLKRTLTTCPVSIFTQEVITVSDCTSSSSIIHLQETYSSRLVAYNYTITLSSPNQWIFDFNYYIQCPNDSFVSIRGPNRVCISVRTFKSPNFCQNRTAGAELCQENSGIGLTGPYSFSEADVIGNYLNLKVMEEPTDFDYDHRNFWTDGTRATFNVTDETLNGTTGYNWYQSVGLSPLLMCSFIFNRNLYPFGVHAYCRHCYDTKSKKSPTNCYRGAVCRTKPILNN
uniref:CW domain-containing protein n=1 Tax=Caenorhabditis tropicalis TaxID=1561998 RepID=A0A1I7TTL8_9PELO